jgi:hypothetical protein
MNRLHLIQEGRWLGIPLAGPQPDALPLLPTWEEIPLLPAMALFLSGLALVVAGIGLYRLWSWLSFGTARQEAAQRAEALLREHVSDRQYQQLLMNGYLTVPSRLHPGRSYWIPYRPGRVEVYEAGHQTGQLCVIACSTVPYPDLILAQKWLIEADERAYLALANPVGVPAPPPALHRLEIRG